MTLVRRVRHSSRRPAGNRRRGDAADRDAYGFSALPAGRNYNGFNDAGYGAYFWSASVYGSYLADDMYLYYDGKGASMGSNYRNRGFSVRCLQN
ncbi:MULTISPECIES: FISUMP domain-containing protein [unclassified Fibrobacter]|uniref:FISUMP domain-containing protein n=1 Tax=unclassified Fibrobacter TaxID=2634177 RepID=UPI001304E75F|nr:MULTISPECIES: FISUMP domain-containing protein [unclassified Fibrobacter]